MADKKYAAFLMGSAAKLLVYLGLCAGAYLICRRFVSYPLCDIASAALAAAVSWFFLGVVEQGKRSFFAKGYLLENVVVGAVCGALLSALPLGIEWALGVISSGGINTAFDIREPMYSALTAPLFTAITVYGYFFHIVQSDFGRIPAVIISAVLFVISPAADITDILSAGHGSENAVLLANLLITGAAVGLMVLWQGDVRSACTMLCLLYFVENALAGLFALTSPINKGAAYSGSDIFSGIIYTAVAAAVAARLIGGIKSRE